MLSTSSKLHLIYAAIDAYQYNRAIKLALALPDSDVLGKALLAHSYAKAGQNYLAVVTLGKMLIQGPSSAFYELRSVLENQQVYDSRSFFSSSSASSSSSSSSSRPSSGSSKTESTTASGNKRGKKGKRKPPSKQQKQQQQQNQQLILDSRSQLDMIDHVDKPPSIPDELDSSFLLSLDHTDIITDETTLATIAVTLKSLNLPLTAFELYAHAADAKPTMETLTKTFNFGLSFLAEPSRWNAESRSKLEVYVLSHMQTVALQLARVAVSEKDDSSLMLATAWACQAALWQLEWLPEDNQRSSILPRLAESMGRRLIQQEDERRQWSKEICMLYLRTLERQSKYDEMLQILENIPSTDFDNHTSNDRNLKETGFPDFGVSFPKNQIKLRIAEILKELERFEDARLLYENLLQTNPDDWSCWKSHLQCSILGSNDSGLTQDLVEKVIKDGHSDSHSRSEDSRLYLRGPNLMRVEIATESLRHEMTDTSLRKLGDAVRQYAEIFAHRSNCAFTDLVDYINILIHNEANNSNRNVTLSLLDFCDSLRKKNKTSGYLSDTERALGGSNKERQAKLRAYIFALKVTHKLLTANTDLTDKYLPNWMDIVREWQATLPLSSSNEGEETQKELKPGDDLILLAVQQLQFTRKCDNSKFISAVLLESGIRHSPDNAHLKFLAMEVFHQLDSSTRSWELFQTIGLKHIQLDSCSFIIHSYLFEGALYNETIDVCTALLRFQNGTARDCGDFAGKAMNSGILTKANEFMVFQRQRMNQSITSLYSKGMILDAAPLLATKHDTNPILRGSIGTTQGIVGGNEDIDRANKMVAEIFNPRAALSVVSCIDRCKFDAYDDLSDNRDVSILSQSTTLVKFKIESKREMVQTSLRRSHVHGLLVRAALCVDAMKGPKKGKLVKPSMMLEKRTQSLLNSVLEASEAFGSDMNNCDTDYQTNGCREFLHVLLNLCRLLAVVNAGMPKIDEDSMEKRESGACDIIENHVLKPMKIARGKNLSTCSPKTVGAILPGYILPIFALFRMCSNVCNVYGWGIRKSKKVSVAMAAFSEELKALLKDNFMICLTRLPSSETDSSVVYSLNENELDLLDKDVVRTTKILLNQAQYKMRMRIEPILEEMISNLAL